ARAGSPARPPSSSTPAPATPPSPPRRPPAGPGGNTSSPAPSPCPCCASWRPRSTLASHVAWWRGRPPPPSPPRRRSASTASRAPPSLSRLLVENVPAPKSHAHRRAAAQPRIVRSIGVHLELAHADGEDARVVHG